MINKKQIKEVNDNGFTIVRGLLNKKDIKHIFSQGENVLDTILDFNKIKYKRKLSVDDKYFLLRKKKPKLKSHFWDSIRNLITSICSNLNLPFCCCPITYNFYF